MTYLRNHKSLAENLIKSATYMNQLFFIFNAGMEEEIVDDSESDYSLFGYKVNLDEKLKQVLKDKLIADFDDLYFSDLDTVLYEDGKSYYLKNSRDDGLEMLEFINRQFNIKQPENSEIKRLVLEKFLSAISHAKEETWEFSEEDMGVIPALVAKLKPYLQLEPIKLIRTYFNSIRFAISFLTFCEFKDIFPKEFKVFYKSLDKNALKKDSGVL